MATAAYDQWFRDNGLPLFVPWRTRMQRLLPRMAPLSVFFAGWGLAGILTGWAEIQQAEFDPSWERLAPVVWPLALAAMALVLVGVGCALLVRALRDRIPDMVLTALVFVSWTIWVLGPVLVSSLRPAELAFWLSLAARGLWVIAVLGLVALGAGDVLRWGWKMLRREIWQLGPMIGRVMPVIMLTMLMVFFNAEMWQVARPLPPLAVAALAAVILLMGISLAGVNTVDELRSIRSEESVGRDLLADTPFAGEAVPKLRAPLRLEQIANLVVVAMAIQITQMLLFAALMAGVFLLLGSIFIQPWTIEQWTGAQAAAPSGFFGQLIPIDGTLIGVSVILAAFCGLAFISSATSDMRYREAFLEPILLQLRVALSVDKLARQVRS